MDPHINKGAERGDVGHDTFENHAGLQILELFHSLAEARHFESRARITSGLLELRQDVGNGRHPEDGIRECPRLEPTEYRYITNQPLQLALGCRKNAPHDRIGSRMYARRIEWIVAVADAQETCRNLESLGSEPRYLLEGRAAAKPTMLLTETDDTAR